MKLFYWIGGALALLFAVPAWAQTGDLTGQVLTKAKEPIAFATIQLLDSSLTTLADEQGRFVFRRLPFGQYQIRISSVEIETLITSVYVNQSHQNIVLQTSPLARDLHEVRVIEKSDKKQRETQGFAVNIIEMKDIAQRNLQTNEALDLTAGVRVRQNGGLGSSVQYNLNGMSGNSVRIFIDGIPIATFGESFSLNSIPPALIDRIEVYKGVIPAHLADDALGGAINIVLKKGNRNQLNASLSYGSFQTIQGNMTGQYRSPTSGFTVKVAGFHNQSDNDYAVWGKFVRNILPNGRYEYVRARRFQDAYQSSGMQMQLGFTDVRWADQFWLGFNGSMDYKEIQHGTYMSIPYMGRFTESAASVFSVSYSKQNLGIRGLELHVNGMYSDRGQTVVDTVKWNYNWFGEISRGLNGEPILRPTGAQQGAPTILTIDRGTGTLRSSLTYALSPQHKFGINYLMYTLQRSEQDDMRSDVERQFVGTRGLIKHVTSWSYAWQDVQSRWQGNLFLKQYYQEIQRSDPRLQMLDGQATRIEERASSQKSTTGYGMATSFRVHKQLTVSTSAEKAVRLPAENEVFGNPGENIVENFGIRPEVSLNYNLGVHAGTFYRQNHTYSFRVNGFIRDARDKIVQRINPRLNDALQTNPYDNLGKTKSIGWEADIQYTYQRNLRLNLAMSRFQSVFNIPLDPNGRPYDYFNQQLPNEPFWTSHATGQYTFAHVLQKNSALQLFYTFRFVERFYTTWLTLEDFRTPRQYTHDLGVSYTFPDQRFLLSIDAKNIFDQQVYDNFAVQKPGRAFYIKFNYQFHSLQK